MPETSLKPDLSLLRDVPLSELYNPRPAEVTRFHKADDGRDFYFVATHHGTDLKDPTHETVKKAIEAAKPQLIIVEGLRTDAGESDRNEFAAQGSRPVAAEQSYAASIARQNNIPFIGGEPSSAALYRAMQEKGYTTKDVMAFNLLVRVTCLRREGVSAQEIEEQAKHYFESDSPSFNHVPQKDRLTYEEFKAQYEPLLKGKDYLETRNRDFEPRKDEQASFFEKLNYAMCRIRNEYLLKTIADAFANNKSVMAVYGNGHAAPLAPALEQMLGKGETFELVPQEPPLVLRVESALPEILRYGSGALALAAAAAIAASAIPLAIGLLAGAVLSFGGSKIAEEKMHDESATTPEPSKPVLPDGRPMPAHDLQRSDGKSWVEASRAQPATLSRV